jgi:hypothetical protein
MGVSKPFHRNFRAIKKAPNSGYSGWAYINDKDYAKNPEHYVRAYDLIQTDLTKLFEYVEPSNESLLTYSYRIHELLMRTCIEIEANFKAILTENIYSPTVNRFEKPIYNMSVYKMVNITHHLSAYEVILPIWNGSSNKFKPFDAWTSGGSLLWYEAYNASKHDRHEQFKKANFQNLLGAVCGLLVILTSQFSNHSFSAESMGLAIGHDYHEGNAAIGGLFRIIYPNDWSDNEMYDFDWSDLKKESERFQKIDFNEIQNQWSMIQ